MRKRAHEPTKGIGTDVASPARVAEILREDRATHPFYQRQREEKEARKREWSGNKNPSTTRDKQRTLKDELKEAYQLYKDYEYGQNGKEQDSKKAINYLEIAAKGLQSEGLLKAKYILACKYRDGEGVAKDMEMSRALLESAVKGGFCDAEFELSMMHLKESNGDKESFSYREHLRLLVSSTKGCKAFGSARGMRMIAYKHLKGEDGFSKSPEMFIKYLTASTKGCKGYGDKDSIKDVHTLLRGSLKAFDVIMKTMGEAYINRVYYTHSRMFENTRKHNAPVRASLAIS